MIDQLIESQAIDPQDWKGLVAFIDVPANPKGLWGVLEGFRRMGKVTGFHQFPYAEVERLMPVSLSVQRAIEQAPKNIRDLLEPQQTSFKRALHGLLTSAPLYCLFYFTLDERSGATLRRLQQAGLVMWHSRYMTESLRRKPELYQYQLAIRSIVESRIGRKRLAKAPARELTSLHSVRDWFAEVERDIYREVRYDEGIEINERKLGREISNSAHAAVRAIDAAMGLKKERYRDTERGPGGRRRRRSWSIRGPQELGDRTWLDCHVPADGDQYNEQPPIYSVQERPDDARVLEELDLLDVDPSELETGAELVVSESDTLPHYVQEYRNKLRLRGMARRIETHNQFLPFSLQQFSQGEVLSFFNALDDSATDSKHGIEKLLLTAMFATSSWFERAQNLEVVTSESKLVRGETELLFFNRSTETWLIPVMAPEYRTSTDEYAESCSREIRCDFVELADPFGFARMLERIQSEAPERGLLFKGRKNLKSRCRKFLKALSSRHTLERVERYLLYRAAGASEPVQASYLFGNALKAGASRAFYTSLPLAHYQSLYRSACQALFDTLQWPLELPEAESDHETKYIGARYCPSRESQKRLIQSLITRVEDWRGRVGVQPEAWVEFHNWYTIFCCVVQANLIGARGIQDPMLSPEQFSESGLATFRDKDSEDQFHTRSIQLSPMALEVSRAYGRHRKRILNRLSLVNHKTFLRLSERSACSAFFLDQKGGFETVRPSTLHPYLSQVSSLPFNSSRKYLRTRMIELEVSPVSVDALLGHASYGEQSWGHFSSIDWCAIYQEQHDALDKIINELGLQVRPGLQT